jgi:hypothetical protein
LLVLVGLSLASAAVCLVVGHWTDRSGISIAGAISLSIAGIVVFLGSAFPGFALAVTAMDAADGQMEPPQKGDETDRFYPPVAALGILLFLAGLVWLAIMLF